MGHKHVITFFLMHAKRLTNSWVLQCLGNDTRPAVLNDFIGDYFELRMNTHVVLWHTAAVYCFIKGQQTILRLSEQYCLGHTSFAESQ